MFTRSHGILASSLMLLGLAGCGQSAEEASKSNQTGFPGQVTANGLASGEVMAKNGTLQAKPDAMSSPVVVPAKAPAENPPSPQPAASSPEQSRGAADAGADQGKTGQGKAEGTPGIPGGAGGNVGGTAMGGTTPGAAATELPSAKAGDGEAEKAKKEAEAKAKAEQEKQQLEAAMERVAQRWQATANTRGWQPESSDSSGDTSGMSMGQSETSAIGLPTVIRSEKLGTAPPSEDIKDPAKEPSN